MPTLPTPAFLHAAQRGSLNAMTAALNEGADPHARTTSGYGAWHLLARRPAHQGVGALSRSQEGIVRLLLEHRVAMDQPDHQGLTPLALAVDAGHERLAARLLALGANPNAPGEDGQTLLGLATEAGRHGTVSALLAAGADVHATDEQGWGALHHGAFTATVMSSAGSYGVAACVEHLLNAGARLQTPTTAVTGNPGETPLQLALRRNSSTVARVLLRAGALAPLGVRARQALLEQGVQRKVWETLDRLAEHGLLDGLRPTVLTRLFADVPPGSTTHRLLEGQVLRAELGPPEGDRPGIAPRARL